MTRIDQATLFTKYPKIFANASKGPAESCMFWGIETGPGWMVLIDTLCSNIQRHIDWKVQQGQEIEQVTADQVKEKFGTLRFYASGGDETTGGMIRLAESMSARICETCGSPGSFRGRGWYYTACDAHTRPEDLAPAEAAV